jgi:flagellar basal-body rod protein FlgB
VDALTSVAALKALDGLEARVTATSENIANALTPGYRPVRVSFEQALVEAAGQGPDAVRSAEIRYRRDAVASPVRIPMELATMVQTQTRYAALIELLSRQIQMQSLAITGNG